MIDPGRIREDDRNKKMECQDITQEEVVSAITQTAHWKAPGVAGVANFWFKKLHAIHEQLTQAYNELVSEKQKTPFWLTKVKTHLIPKNEKT